MDKVRVSIFMLTYNQEEYIAQAIEGVLMQKTDFVIQLVIGEDFSTDRTRSICKDYAKKYPEKIKLILNKKNLGLGTNYVKTLQKCTGEYLAICDGDDYWIDPLKLQKQVDFLEENPEFDLIFTNNNNLFPTGDYKIRDTKVVLGIGAFNNLVFDNYIPSVTVLFKHKPLPESMEIWMKNLPYGDWPTYLWVLKDGGKIKFLDEVTAVYRKNFGTSTILRQERSKIGEINLSILKNLEVSPYFLLQRKHINSAILKIKIGLMASYNKEGKYFKSFILWMKITTKENFIFIARRYFYSLKRRFASVQFN